MNNPVNLTEIAKWGDANSEVSIPALQRGLVWSPKQIEFLWDSILRNFPVGGFVLSETEDNSFYLMDGQQRFNAIKSGFCDPTDESESILWIDIKPKISEKSTRNFFIKVTTKIHPWGFKNDENASTLNAGERREALEAFGMSGKNIFKDKISLLETFPVMSGFPIPFAYLINATLDSPEEFSDFIIKKLDMLSAKWKEKVAWDKSRNKQDCKEVLEQKYFLLIKNLLQEKPYAVPCSFLPLSTMNQESENTFDANEQTNLEILFNRLNTGGTQISRADLYYSAIKAYWGDSFKYKIDELSKDRMPAQTLAMLLLRLALTVKDESSTKFMGNLSVSQIRGYARNAGTKQFIENFIANSAERIIKAADDALSDLPKFLVMKIVTEKNDIYLLLLYFAYCDFDLKTLKVANLAMILYWFAVDVSSCTNELFSYFKNNTLNLEEARKVISRLTVLGKIRNIYEPNELRSAFNPIALQKPNIETPLEKFWEIISNAQRNDTGYSLLIFAEKDFLNRYFPNFTPASVKCWDKTNRPWDYDHIIPQSWSYNQSKSNPYKEIADYWLWRNGNFAAIPFEVNRSKNAFPEYDFYEQNAEELLFTKEIEKVHTEFLRDKTQAETFARLTFERTIQIFEKCYDYISAWAPVLCDVAEHRKQFFTELQKKMTEFKTYFVSGNKEYEIACETDWESQCITLAYEINPVCMLAVTWNAGLYQNEYGKEMLEVGFRKHYAITTSDVDFFQRKQELLSKNSLGVPASLNQWWYQCKIVNVDASDILHILSQMITFCKVEIEECDEDK